MRSSWSNAICLWSLVTVGCGAHGPGGPSSPSNFDPAGLGDSRAMATTGSDAAAAGEKAIKIVQGSIDLRPGPGSRSVSLRGTRGFTLEARAGTGREPGDACAYVPCVPGSTVQLVAVWAGIDLPGTATLRGQTFTNVGGLLSRTSAGIVVSGTWVAPPQAVTASIDLPVTLSGQFIWPDGREPLEGTGSAELSLQWLDALPAGWRVTGASFEFGGRHKH